MAEDIPHTKEDVIKLARTLVFVVLPLLGVSVLLGAAIIGKHAYLIPHAPPWLPFF